jgi:hypothetical protein
MKRITKRIMMTAQIVNTLSIHPAMLFSPSGIVVMEASEGSTFHQPLGSRVLLHDLMQEPSSESRA